MTNKTKTVQELYHANLRLGGATKLSAFLDALDEKLEGNVLYDFWWWNIWSNITTPFHKIKEHHQQKIYAQQRKEDGISEQDVWCLSEYIYEILYKGCLELSRNLWGKNRHYPLSTSEIVEMDDQDFTYSQDIMFCYLVQRYIRAYETYRPYDMLEGFPESDVERPRNNFLKRFFLPGRCFRSGCDAVLESKLSPERERAIIAYNKRSWEAFDERRTAFKDLVNNYMGELSW